MKNKITPSVILLIITVIFFIAGIFFMGIQARQQISDTEQSLDAFISQVKDKQSIAILRSHPKLSLPFSVRATADSRDIL